MRNRSLFSENQYQTMMRNSMSENQKKREVRTSKSENHRIAEVRTTLSENQGPTKNSAEEFECVEYVDFNGNFVKFYF